MGLDQWAYAVKGEERKEIFYWRKHPDLEGWAATLWHERGGEGDFNCQELELDMDDIDALEGEHRNLAKCVGFFFGETSEEDIESTQEFIGIARQHLQDGYKIIYTSWW
jgi:hypothetical protein